MCIDTFIYVFIYFLLNNMYDSGKTELSLLSGISVIPLLMCRFANSLKLFVYEIFLVIIRR